MVLEFKVHEQTIEAIASNVIPRRKSREYLSLKFYFAEDWGGYLKTVYFQYEEYSVPILIGDSGEVDVPDFFAQQDHFLVMLVGINGEEACPTNVLCITLDESGTAWETEPPSTEAPAYQQLVELVNQAISADHGYIKYTEPQEMTEKEKDQARKNIGAVSTEDLEAKQTFLPIARGQSADGISYVATDAFSGFPLPEVRTGREGTRIGKGRQIVFIPDEKNKTTAPTLQINDGEVIPIRFRAPCNQGADDAAPDATLPVPVGALMRGVPYTMTFCGMYWLVDSMIDLHPGAVTQEAVGAMIADAIGDTAGALAAMDHVIGGAGV